MVVKGSLQTHRLRKVRQLYFVNFQCCMLVYDVLSNSYVYVYIQYIPRNLRPVLQLITAVRGGSKACK